MLMNVWWPFALGVNFTLGDYVHATDGLEFCAPGIRREAVLLA